MGDYKCRYCGRSWGMAHNYKNLMIEFCNTCACVGTLTCVELTEDIVVQGISYVILSKCIHKVLSVKVETS